MPSVIAIEAKPVEFEGIDSGYLHLYLVKTVTDEQGRVVSEKVIRGTAGSGGDLETLAGSNLATSPDRRGSDTLEERHRTVLDLGTRDASDVWRVMVQHASNIEKADLRYSIDIFREFSGGDLNSNSVVASVLHSAGIDWTTSLPSDVSRSDAPLYGQLQYMKVNDVFSGTTDSDRILGGVGNDTIYGKSENDKLSGEVGNDRLWGSAGNDTLSGGANDDRLYGGYGSDALIGGSGKDAFVFHTKLTNPADIDSIRDFSVASDTVWLENSVFTALGSAGRLKSAAFWTGDQAHDATDRVVYDRDDGILYYDPDGHGAAEQVVVSRIDKGLKITSADFQVI
jgi:Ca2+-binding RTX toxin-like protein